MQAFTHFDTLDDFTLRIRGYGIIVENGDYNFAEQILNSYQSESQEELDFIEIQRLNLRRLIAHPNEAIYNESELSYINDVSYKSDPLAAYARGLWFNLTGEEIRIPLPSEDVFPRSKTIENAEKNNVKVYPNPFKNSFTLDLGSDFKKGEEYNVAIFDINGIKILNKNIYKKTTFINLSDIDEGIYLVHIITENGTLITKKIHKSS